MDNLSSPEESMAEFLEERRLKANRLKMQLTWVAKRPHEDQVVKNLTLVPTEPDPVLDYFETKCEWFCGSIIELLQPFLGDPAQYQGICAIDGWETAVVSTKEEAESLLIQHVKEDLYNMEFLEEIADES